MAVRLWLREQQKFLLNYIPDGISLDAYVDGIVTGVVDDAVLSVVPRGCVMARAKVMRCRRKSVPFALVSGCAGYPSGLVIAPREIYSAFYNNQNSKQAVVALGWSAGWFVQNVFSAYYGAGIRREGLRDNFLVLAASTDLEGLLSSYEPLSAAVLRVEIV